MVDYVGFHSPSILIFVLFVISAFLYSVSINYWCIHVKQTNRLSYAYTSHIVDGKLQTFFFQSRRLMKESADT